VEFLHQEIQDQKDQERNQKALKDSFLKAVENTFMTPQGRKVAWELLNQCGVFRTTFRRNAESAFLEGRRSVGLDLLSLIGEADYQLLGDILLMGFKQSQEEKAAR
jgi:response regulator of citrate/malate metabolism